MFKKSLAVLAVVSSLVFVIAACGESNEDACNKFDSLCSGTTSTDAGASGADVNVVTKCDPNGFDKYPQRERRQRLHRRREGLQRRDGVHHEGQGEVAFAHAIFRGLNTAP